MKVGDLYTIAIEPPALSPAHEYAGMQVTIVRLCTSDDGDSDCFGLVHLQRPGPGVVVDFNSSLELEPVDEDAVSRTCPFCDRSAIQVSLHHGGLFYFRHGDGERPHGCVWIPPGKEMPPTPAAFGRHGDPLGDLDWFKTDGDPDWLEERARLAGGGM